MQTVQLTEREREHRVHSLCSGAVINANSAADREREREHRVHSLYSGAMINANSAADRERECTGYAHTAVEL